MLHVVVEREFVSQRHGYVMELLTVRTVMTKTAVIIQQDDGCLVVNLVGDEVDIQDDQWIIEETIVTDLATLIATTVGTTVMVALAVMAVAMAGKEE